MVRRELVKEEKWIGSGSFNRLLAVMQVLPGPEAHELCVHLGVRAKGRIGGLLAGLGFMLPGFLLMLALAWAYTKLMIEGSWLGAWSSGCRRPCSPSSSGPCTASGRISSPILGCGE